LVPLGWPAKQKEIVLASTYRAVMLTRKGGPAGSVEGKIVLTAA